MIAVMGFHRCLVEGCNPQINVFNHLSSGDVILDFGTVIWRLPDMAAHYTGDHH